MLLIDMSNLVFSAASDYHRRTGDQMDINLLRHIVLSTLKSTKDKLRVYADEIVLCFDSRNYWRRQMFPHYKGKRKENRDKDKMDWQALFNAYTQLKVELKENFPFHCIEVDTAEADDIIAVLVTRFAPLKDICIASSDGDFIQLQQNVCPKIKQWSLYHKKFITPKNQQYDLFEHICRGDDGDGVPNILSDDDTFVDPLKRQKPVMAKKLQEWCKAGIAQPERFCLDVPMLRRFERNKTLIDLRCVPEEVAAKIVEAYDTSVPPKGMIFSYMVANRLTKLMSAGSF